MKWFDLVGLAGVFCFLTSYALLQARRISVEDYCYTALNLAGAVLLMLSLFFAFNLASMLSQIMWIGISLFGLIKTKRERRRQRQQQFQTD